MDFEAPLQVAGKRMFLRPCDFLESTDNPFDAAERETSIMFNYAQETFEALSVSLPEGWEIEALPSDTAITNKIGTCALSFKKVGGSLSVQRRFVLNSPYWRVEDYAAVQELFAGREALNGLTVVLKKSIK